MDTCTQLPQLSLFVCMDATHFVHVHTLYIYVYICMYLGIYPHSLASIMRGIQYLFFPCVLSCIYPHSNTVTVHVCVYMLMGLYKPDTQTYSHTVGMFYTVLQRAHTISAEIIPNTHTHNHNTHYSIYAVPAHRKSHTWPSCMQALQMHDQNMPQDI